MLCGAIFDVPKKKIELAKLEEVISLPDFWNDPEKSQKLMQDRKRLEQAIADESSITGRVSDIDTLFELGREGEEIGGELSRELKTLETQLEKLETGMLLSGENDGRWAILIDPQGRRYAHELVAFEPKDSWRSTRTFQDYPTNWTLEIPEAKLSVALEAAFADQEFITVISKPAFWEGRVDVKGTLAGRPITGTGYVERSGFSDVDSLDDFFGKVGEEVRKSVRALYPTELTFEHAQNLIANPDRHTYMDGVDLEQLRDRHGVDPAQLHAKHIDRMIDLGLVSLHGSRLRLTRSGLPHANDVWAGFVG